MKHFSEISPTAERVVDAAEGLVQQHGFNGFSYDDVAKLVGIKKPSIHHHFATKAELVAVVAQRYTHRFSEQLLHIETRHADPLARLKAYAALFERTFAEERRLCVCGMLGAEAESLPSAVATEVQKFFQINLDWLTGVFTAARKALLVTAKPSASELAESFLCAMEGAMVVGRGRQSTRGPRLIAATLLSTMLA